MPDRNINRRKFMQKAGAGALLAGSAVNSAALAGGAGPAGNPPRAKEEAQSMGVSESVRLITLDPAHFHAALVQKQMLPGISKRVAIYAPLGPDLLAHLKLIEQFNSRPDNPTSWELDIHCSPRSLEEMIAARPGNVVVLAGRNRIKIGKIKASLEAGLNVLSDKPWIIRAEDFPALEAALALADQKGLVAYDMMTERHEITTILQRELVNDPAVFGTMIPADPNHPGVFMESTHHILKTVAGTPNPRPLFFFDILDQGEGLTDVGHALGGPGAVDAFPRSSPQLSPATSRFRMASVGRPPSPLAQFPAGHRRGGFPRRICLLTFTGTSSITTATIRWTTKFVEPRCG